MVYFKLVQLARYVMHAKCKSVSACKIYVRSEINPHKVSKTLTTTLRRKIMIPKIILTILALNFFVITASILRFIADERIRVSKKEICGYIIAYTACAIFGGLCIGLCTVVGSGGFVAMLTNPLLGRNTVIGLLLMFAGSWADMCMYVSRKEPDDNDQEEEVKETKGKRDDR